MTKPKVSLLMPVYNSFSYERSDGKRLLPLALNSLLRQSFKDFELIILDNQSTDDTQKICKEYTEKDSRIKFIVDEEKRFAEAAISRLGDMAAGEYSLIVNDDDLWEKNYLKKAVAYLDKNPNVELVYGKAIFTHPNNFIIGMYDPPKGERYGIEMSRLGRLIRYTNVRNVIPINFGLFRTAVFKSILPYEDFDTLKWNVDNILMSKFFLLGYKAEYIKDLLFFYRQKSRRLNPALFARDMPELKRPVALWLFYVFHQLLFFKKIQEMAKTVDLSEEARTYLRSTEMYSSIKVSFKLLRWLEDELIIQKKMAESAVLGNLIEEYKKEMRADIESYADPETSVMGNEKVLQDDIVLWQSKIKRTMTVFKGFMGKAALDERTDDSYILIAQINSILDEELEALPSGLKEITAILLKSAHSFFSVYTFKEVLRDNQWLKKLVIFLRGMYLNVRYLRAIFYTR